MRRFAMEFALVIAVGVIAGVAVLLAAGCAMPKVRAQVIEYEGVKAKVIVADEERIKRVCWGLLKQWERRSGKVARNDDGTVVTQPPGACVRPASFFKGAVAFLPDDPALFMWYAGHEVCHLFNPGEPEKCDKKGYVK